ncbi:MAG: twitching motility protein PilT [Proteobacteria bacterium]|nr:twitching motility protein PilT [Pseudomonadota bacterium]
MKKQAKLIFYGELKELLAPEHKAGTVLFRFERSPSVKDTIESLGVPHTEAGLIIAGEEAVGFTHLLRDGNEIRVYPHDGIPDIYREHRLPFMPEGSPAFILDVHLGRLARYLRIAGFDTIYSPEDMGDEVIADAACREGRIVLTCDRGLLKRSNVRYGHLLRSRDSRGQLREVVARYSLKNLFKPFSRCIHCNGSIEEAKKEDVLQGLPAGIKRDFDDFYRCSNCGHVYWQGSHYKRIQDFLGSL